MARRPGRFLCSSERDTFPVRHRSFDSQVLTLSTASLPSCHLANVVAAAPETAASPMAWYTLQRRTCALIGMEGLRAEVLNARKLSASIVRASISRFAIDTARQQSRCGSQDAYSMHI